jgi:hypothetical protein
LAFVIATMVLVATLLLVFRQLTRYKPKPKLPKGFHPDIFVGPHGRFPY